MSCKETGTGLKNPFHHDSDHSHSDEGSVADTPLFHLNSFSCIQVALYQCEERTTVVDGSTTQQSIKTHTRHYRGDVLLPCPKGCTYRFWVYLLEHRLQEMAVLHPLTVEAAERARCMRLPLCEKVPRMEGKVHPPAASTSHSFHPLRITVAQVQERYIDSKRKSTYQYRVVAPNRWDKRWYEKEETREQRKPYRKFRCFFSPSLIVEEEKEGERHPPPPSLIPYGVYLKETRKGKRAPLFVLNLRLKDTPHSAMRLGISDAVVSREEGPIGFCTLQESVVQRLHHRRGIKVSRIIDAKSGLPLLPSENAYVVARLFPALMLEIAAHKASIVHPTTTVTPRWETQIPLGSVISMSELSDGFSKTEEDPFYLTLGSEVSSGTEETSWKPKTTDHTVSDWSPISLKEMMDPSSRLVKYSSTSSAESVDEIFPSPSDPLESMSVRNSLHTMNEAFVYEIDEDDSNSVEEKEEESHSTKEETPKKQTLSEVKRTRLATISSPSQRWNQTVNLSSQHTVALGESEIRAVRRSGSTLESILQRESQLNTPLHGVRGTPVGSAEKKGVVTELVSSATKDWSQKKGSDSPQEMEAQPSKEAVESTQPIQQEKRHRSPIMLEASDLLEGYKASISQPTFPISSKTDHSSLPSGWSDAIVPSTSGSRSPSPLVRESKRERDSEPLIYADDGEWGEETASSPVPDSSPKRLKTEEEEEEGEEDDSTSTEEEGSSSVTTNVSHGDPNDSFMLMTQQALPEIITLEDSDMEEEEEEEEEDSGFD